MKPIRVITQDFELLTEIDLYTSAQVVRMWHGIGELELHINRYTKDANLLQKGVLLFLGSDTHKVYIIRSREIPLEEDGKVSENWVIRAPALKAIVGQRLTLPPSSTAYDNKQGDAETVMKHYIERNVTNPDDANRIIQNVEIAPNQNRGINVNWRSRFKNLAEEMTEISQFSGLGWNIYLDLPNQKWVFDVTESNNLTTSQISLPPVIFSPKFDSLQSLNYSESELDYRNFAYVAGQGEGTDRRVIELGGQSGIERHELFVDARNVDEEEDGQQRPEQDIINELTNRGQEELSKMEQEEYLEGQILTKSPFKYEDDYDLGDIVTVQNKDWNVTMDARITELKEIYEPSGFQIEAIFGNDRPTLIDKLQRVLGQFDNEMKK